MGRRGLAAIVVVLLGTLSLGSVTGARAQQPRAAAHQDFPPRPGATPIVIGLPNLNPPTATPVAASGSTSHPQKPPAPPNAVRIALSNGYVRALLAGKAYRVQQVAPWASGKGKIVVTGFYHPVSVTGTWLAMNGSAYRATYRQVSALQIYVALPARKVRAIVPRLPGH